MVPDERRALIVRAARDLFSQRPYAEVSVADIAQAAGVSPPLIVFHYGSKQSLYLALLETAADAIRAGLNELPGPPSLDRLRAGVRFYAGYARDHRAGFLSLLRGGQGMAEAAALVEAFRDELAGQILADLTAAGRTPAGAGPAGQMPAGAGPGGQTPAGAGPGSASTLTFLAVRGYLGYVDAMVVHWLALPGDDRDQVTPAMIADVAAGVFTSGQTAARSLTPAAASSHIGR
jgi:AcrR family transcriptional regulator